MRFTPILAAALPLLARFICTFARPIQLDSDELAARYANDLEIRETPFDFTGDYNLREIEDYLETRAKSKAATKAPAAKAPKPKKKVSASAQKARKDNVRSNVANNQANKAAKKKSLQKTMASPNAPKYGRPRSAGKQKPNQPGYRAKGRAEGKRLPKQPKTPKPNMKKGDPRSAKSKTRQAAANQRTKDRKAAGRANHAGAKEAYRKTTSLPGRRQTFTAPGGEKIKGKDVRTAVFNQHKNNKGKNAPKPFNNHVQGAANNKHKPLPKMKGSGHETPIAKDKSNVGVFRAITQPKQKGGTSFKGVVAHDSRRNPTDPGYNDHNQVKAKKH